MKDPKFFVLVPIALVVLMVLASPVLAEVSIRECIRFSPPGTKVVIPASNTRDLATLDFEIKSASDAIFDAAIFFQDSDTVPSSRARYKFLIDGGNNYTLGLPMQYFARTPINTDGTIHVRSLFQDIPTGIHQATLRVINPSTTDLEIGGVWITPLFVDAAETGVTDQRLSQQFVSSGWTTIGQITVPTAPTNRSIYLYAYVRAAAPGEVEFRYQTLGTTLETFTMNFHNRRDGGVFKFLLKDATPGDTITFDARGTATIQLSELSAQTLEKYSVLEAELDIPKTLINNLVDQQVVASPEVVLNSLSLSGPLQQPNQFRTCGWGGAKTLMSMADSTETLIKMKLFRDGSSAPLFNDIGVNGHSPDPLLDIYRDQSDWGCNVGLFSTSTYRVELFVQGLCNGGAPMTVEQARFQILVLPSPNPNSHVCTDSHQITCPFQCALNPGLPLVAAPPRSSCN